jgi:hypothetical protein
MRLHGPRQQLSLPFAGFLPVARTSWNLPSFCLALQLRRPPASIDFLPPKIDATPSACFYYRFQLTRGLSAEVLQDLLNDLGSSMLAMIFTSPATGRSILVVAAPCGLPACE